MKRVEIVEVAPRDGFQAVKAPIPTDEKIATVRNLLDAGLERVEMGAFVSPKAIPQMADVAEVWQAVRDHRPGARLSVLVPNARGTALAAEAGLKEIVYVVSASEAHNESNVRRSIAASLADFAQALDVVRAHDMRLRFNISTCFDCPFDGRVDPADVFAVIEAVLDMTDDVEFGLCDTTGRAFPDQVAGLCGDAIARYARPGVTFAFHGHDTYGFGVANALYAWDAGIRVIDASAAGLGGCPFAPGATGNTATEDLVFAFANMGIETGVDLENLLAAADRVAAIDPPSTGGHVRGLPRGRVLLAA